MKGMWKHLLVVALLAAGLLLVSFTTGSTKKASADNPYCNPASGVYNSITCQNTGGPTANPGCVPGLTAATCTGQYGSQYCQAPYYNAQLCSQGGQYGQSIYCTIGSGFYDANICAQQTGQYNSAYAMYCQPATYNAQLCAQAGGAAAGGVAAYAIYCQPANYNAQLCAQAGGAANNCAYNPAYCTNQPNPYCQEGTASFNPTLCNQYSMNIYGNTCVPGAINYNAAVCNNGVYNGAYCTPGAAQYNAAYCQQTSTYANSPACNPGSGLYSPQLCAQYGNGLVGAVCTPGNASYNQTLCQQYGGAVAALTPAAGPATQVLIQAAGNSISCGGSTAVVLAVRSATGAPVADGTSVTLSASIGTMSSSTVTIQAGQASAVYRAPSTPGSATITANAGGISNSTTVNVTCSSSSAPSNSAPPPPPSSGNSLPPAPPPGSTVLRPPNTGDAGLKAFRVE